MTGVQEGRVFDLDPSWSVETAVSAAKNERDDASALELATDLAILRTKSGTLQAVYGPNLRRLAVGDELVGATSGTVAAVVPSKTEAGAWLLTAAVRQVLPGMSKTELTEAKRVIEKPTQWSSLRQNASAFKPTAVVGFVPATPESGPATHVQITAQRVPGAEDVFTVSVNVDVDAAGAMSLRLMGRGPAVEAKASDPNGPQALELGAQLVDAYRTNDRPRALSLVASLHQLLAPPKAARGWQRP